MPLPLIGALACSSAGGVKPAALSGGTREGRQILAVVPATGVRVNARVPPALELPDGRVLRLSTGATTADSAYFVEPPWTVRPADLPKTATLRVSYCRTDEALCRTETSRVRTPSLP